MIIRNTNRFEYYIIQLFNDVNIPRCQTENLSYENIFILFQCYFLQFYFLGHKYKGHDFIRAGPFAPVAPPSATHQQDIKIIMKQVHRAECKIVFLVVFSVHRLFSIFSKIEKVQHEKSATWKKCNIGKVQHENNATRKTAIWKECSMKKVQHGKSAIWK